METCPAEGVTEEQKFLNTRKPSHRWVCGEFWNLRGQHNQEGEKKKKTPDYVTSCNSQWKGSLDTCVCQQQWGLNRETWAACIGWGPGLNALRTI